MVISFVCGNNVCKKHLDELLKNIPKETTNFECEIYNNEHSIRTKSFVINKRMQQGLEIEFITFELTTVYDECKVDIQKANKNVEKIESLRKNSESYIYEYFEDLNRQFDIRKEDLMEKIDKYYDELIQSIEANQLNYINLSTEVNYLSINIDKSKQKLDGFIKQFDTLDLNDKKFKDIKNSVSIVKIPYQS